MGRNPRTRHYLSPVLLVLLRPLFRWSYGRGAYVLRFVGEHRGPVLREDRRHRQSEFAGPERRSVLVGQDHQAIAG
jgi:hypothetical protein